MKNILVTGANRGLGLAITKRLANEGYQVLATARATTSCLDLEIQRFIFKDKRIKFYPFDLSNVGEIHNFVRNIIKENGHIYGLINNAALGHDGILATMHESQIAELLQVNVMAAILLAKYASRSMLIQQNGRIINISSIIASTGFNGLSVYAASKSALIGFTKSLARELGKAGITVNAIAPGFMETGMTASLKDGKLETIVRRSPMRELPSVEDIAAAVSFIIGAEAAHITGTTLTVDAGSTA